MAPGIEHTTIAEAVQALLPDQRVVQIERMLEGGSTIVYRITTLAATSYLRICPEADRNLLAEAAVHERLGAVGLHVPLVLHSELLHPTIQRSIMLTTAIPGRAIGYTDPPRHSASIMRAAGRELARINQVPVQGYGWLTSVQPTTGMLCAEYSTCNAWLQAHFTAPIQALAESGIIAPQAAVSLTHLLDHAARVFRDEPAVLSHGDFDVTHIFIEGIAYTGIIDFGEIRGTHWIYDLAHYAIECIQFLPALLDGYQEIRPLTTTDQQHIHLTSLLIAARRIGIRLTQQRKPHPPDLTAVRALLAMLP